MEPAAMTLQEYKELSQLTDDALADLVGVERSYIVKLRNGTSTPSLSVLAKIRVATKGAVDGAEWLDRQEG
jgi:transcriptional regulator with XRE-family HTH domain